MQIVGVSADRHRIAGLVASAAGVGVIAGAAFPWLTVFHGLRSYAGISGLNGRLLAGGGAAAVVLGGWSAIQPRRQLRYAIGGLGFALALACAYLMAQLLDIYHGLQGVYLPTIGPGLPIAAASSLVMIATLFVGVDEAPGDLDLHLQPSAATLLALSAGAGTIHLAVAAEHFVEFPLYGVFFIVLGGAQLGWAALIVIRGLSRTLLLLGTGNAVVAWLWVVSRTTGVPFGPSPWVPEPVGVAGVASTVFEVVLVGLASWLLMRRTPRPNHLVRAGWALPLVVGAATIVVVLVDVSAHGHSLGPS